MKVIVVGAGVIGVTTAYFLAKAGHEVMVIDRQSGPAMETSFANAGQITPSYTGPWGAPGLVLKAISWIIKDNGPLKVRFGLSPERYRWLFSLYQQCTSERNQSNFEAMMALSCKSQALFDELLKEHDIHFDHGKQGNLEVFTDTESFESVSQQIKRIEQFGLHYQVLSKHEITKVEPGMNTESIVGGVAFPDDETGDCYAFTTALADVCKRMGVQFRFGYTVRSIHTANQRVSHLQLDEESVPVDQLVLCTGSYTNDLLHGVSKKLPIYPVKGYSLTLPITNSETAPASTVLDDKYKVAITRLGNRVRVGGFAEICGFDLSLPDSRRQILESALLRLYPEIGYEKEKASFWSGLRPMTPTGIPVIGQLALENLWINAGHGTFGWTMCLGSAEKLASMLAANRNRTLQ
ncbi:D-amino acid dehydrogenase [Leeia sp. TBRC 13508]|uniref:D-amino acid dehydrogenase n=1 Tax=Leeia speluncae TaxID=2884804 RepID=A0ABS8D9B0_9NEIS|nr:D-amino acid dehydrogenase [Leeia speluncae]MCB6184526.1 D-amino acid dehydrogenase [Leeia speluncae]